MTKYDSVVTRVFQYGKRCVGIDVRALAVFRVMLGSILLVDLVLRARYMTVFYTDAGVLSRETLTSLYPVVSQLSIHTVSGGVGVQAVLFSVAAVCAVCVIAGWRTKLALICSWVLLISLHARNPLVLNAGDSLLRRLVFWSLFLPVGQYWSIDAGYRETQFVRESVITSIGSVGVLLQVVMMYTVNGVLKVTSGDWGRGNTLQAVYDLEAYTTGVGVFVSEFETVLAVAGSMWVGLLLGSTALLVTRGWKRVGVVCAYGVGHVVMLVTMQIGLFPVISLSALLLFIPRGVWETVEQNINERVQLGGDKIRERGSDGVGVRVVRRGSVESVWKACRDLVSWGAVGVVKRYGVVLVGCGVLAALLYWNGVAVGVVDTPENVEMSVEPSENTWDMFVSVSEKDTWVSVIGVAETGEKVPVISGVNARDSIPSDSESWYPTSRWRKFLYNVASENSDELLVDATRGVCNSERGEQLGEENMDSVALYKVIGSAERGETMQSTEVVTTPC